MPYKQTILPHYSFEEWLRWEGRWELIEGIPIALVPLPPVRHQLICGNLNSILNIAMKKTKCSSCFAYPPIAYKVSDDTILQPDTSIVAGSIEKDYLDYAPVLVMEVLSKETVLWDRHTKFYLYEQQGIRYYLIVDPDKNVIEIYELVNGEYKLQPYSNTFTFVLAGGCTIAPDLSEAWE